MQNLGKAKAAQPGLNQDDLKGIEILQPNKEYIYKYKKTIEPLLAKLFNNAKEIASLTKQRDELLPLLMNGQVSVDQGLYINFVNDFDEKMFVIFDNIRVKKQENNKLTELQFLLLAKMVQIHQKIGIKNY